MREGEPGDPVFTGLLGGGGLLARRMGDGLPVAGEKGEKGGEVFESLGMMMEVRGVGEAGLGLISGGGVSEEALGDT